MGKDTSSCSECGLDELYIEYVDIGVGSLRRPAYCLNCGYKEEDTFQKLIEELSKND